MASRLRFLVSALLIAVSVGALRVPGVDAAMPTPDQPILASITQGTECDADLGCMPPLQDRPIPRFLRIDVRKKLITILAPIDRKGETTAIQFVEQMDDRIVIGGTEAKRVWSAILHQDGTMTLGLSDVGVGFVVFGNWMVAEDATK